MNPEDNLSHPGRQTRKLKQAALGLAGLLLCAVVVTSVLLTERAGRQLPPERHLMGQWRGKGLITYDRMAQDQVCPDRATVVADVDWEAIDVWATFWSDRTYTWQELHHTVFQGPQRDVVLPSKMVPHYPARTHWKSVRAEGNTLLLRLPGLAREEVSVTFQDRDSITITFRAPAHPFKELTLPPGTVRVSLSRDQWQLLSEDDVEMPLAPRCCNPWVRGIPTHRIQ
jgi:hypothetical protein